MHRLFDRGFRLFPLAILWLAAPLLAQSYAPKIDPASDEAEKAIKKFAVAQGLKVTLWAAEPALANPVAFCIDVHGRIFVAETFRLHKGVTDNRSHSDWLDEELACRTVADRVAMYQRKFSKDIDDWRSEHERIRLLTDTDGDGKADRSVVYADGFKQLPDGIGAGLLAYQGKVWFTCIPKLWILEDTDGDGQADRRQAVQDGYGVHTSLLGHDLHGLRIGPDGKLYFSIGDRGFHVVTEQRTLSFPDEGAVLRCNLDGSELEVVHRGLRNPQELAFDNYGNLFTGDNNSDGGDKARWVYVVEGGNSGWHIGYQSISGRGAWNKEKLWHPHWRGQAAYIVPPIANLANGPSGLTFNPGIGLPERYHNKFFLCEFRGGSSNSGILAVGMAAKGASFELTDEERFLWKVLPTDVEFGYDGALYVSDWTEGWGQPLKGRIYRVAVPGIEKDARVRRVARILQSQSLSPAEYRRGLSAADQRLRQFAQFGLVKLKAGYLLMEAARQAPNQLARIHGIWGVGQLGREDPKLAEQLLELLADPDHEIRAQVAKVMGQLRHAAAIEPLIELLKDRSSRVRFFAAISLGQLGAAKALDALVAMLRQDDERDPYLRHAGVMGLSGIEDLSRLSGFAEDPSRAVRMALVLVYRRRLSPEVERFLDDPDPLVVLEAARAIHDVPIDAAMPRLAEVLLRPAAQSPQLLTRAVNANFRVATAACIQRLKRCITSTRIATSTRVDAIEAAIAWAKPSGRDRVINLWRPLAVRDPIELLASLRPHLAGLLKAAPDAVCEALLRLLEHYELRELGSQLVAVVKDQRRPGGLRSQALAVLDHFAHGQVTACAKLAAADPSTELRQLGVRILSRLDPESALPVLEKLIATATLSERQNAMATLGGLKTAAADAVLLGWLDRLGKGEVDKKLRLELLDAAGKRQDDAVLGKLRRIEARRADLASKDILRSHDECLEGGDVARGKDLFWRDDAAISCQRCHRIGERGGDAGPDLLGIGSRLSREQILSSLLDPGRQVASGFGTVVFTLKDDSVVAGVVKEETATQIELLDAEGKKLHVVKAEVAERSDPVSAMPPLSGILQKAELRDLVEFLVSQRQPAKSAAKSGKSGKSAATGHGGK